jgi:hypothetical protein
VKVNLRFTFAWSGLTPEETFFELFRTVDIGAGGARVVRHVPESPIPLVGARGECAFCIEQTEVRVEAIVVRHSPDGFVVRFSTLRRVTEDRLAAWVFRHEALALVRRTT